MCPRIMSPANGTSSCSTETTNPGGSCTVSCDPGYEVQSGDDMRTCQDNGIWSGGDAACTPSKCLVWALVWASVYYWCKQKSTLNM